MRDPYTIEMDRDVEEGLSANLTLNCSPFCAEKVLPESNLTQVSSEALLKPNFSVTVVYCALFVVAAVGNLTVFISLFRSRHRKSRISLMIRHLAIADLIVTFIMIPLE
ncbi:gonadotropin-releasing hormone II receptor-like, partial [Anoplophora glabripennis]|uniref:gonadotropin-releasing hormone II receptor-like n=1 Tax=Anoplophora glabripennis TaxID=217634 RepID=UPI0008744374